MSGHEVVTYVFCLVWPYRRYNHEKKPAMKGGQATFEGRACRLDLAG